VAMQPYSDGSLTFGQTALDAGDFVPPRVKICQQMSQEVADKKAAAGEFFNTLTGENYGTELKFIPIQPFKQRIFLVREEKRAIIEAATGISVEGQGLACRSYDMVHGTGTPGGECAECPLAVWVERQPPYCTETYNVAALTELGELVFLGFQKSSAKVGKNLFSMLRLSMQAPWSRVYSVKSRQTKNALGNFYVPDVTREGDVPAPELLKVAASWARQLSGVVIDVADDEPLSSSEEYNGDAAPF
jgi:hypothetical protein